MEKQKVLDISDFVLKIHTAVEKVIKEEELVAVPFYPNVWGTTKIKYDCAFCYSGYKLNTGDIPYYCAHDEYIAEHLNNGAKPTSCVGCPHYQLR